MSRTPDKACEPQRTVSPQRLVHYRNTWYLNAWCHASDGLRRFALDAIREATLLEQRAKDVAVKTSRPPLRSDQTRRMVRSKVCLTA